MGIDLNTDELEYIFKQIDVDNDGDVTFEEFATYVWHFGENDEDDDDDDEKKKEGKESAAAAGVGVVGEAKKDEEENKETVKSC
jgi:EF hand